jgi:hypothetical protein
MPNEKVTPEHLIEEIRKVRENLRYNCGTAPDMLYIPIEQYVILRRFAIENAVMGGEDTILDHFELDGMKLFPKGEGWE